MKIVTTPYEYTKLSTITWCQILLNDNSYYTEFVNVMMMPWLSAPMFHCDE